MKPSPIINQVYQSLLPQDEFCHPQIELEQSRRPILLFENARYNQFESPQSLRSGKRLALPSLPPLHASPSNESLGQKLRAVSWDRRQLNIMKGDFERSFIDRSVPRVLPKKNAIDRHLDNELVKTRKIMFKQFVSEQSQRRINIAVHANTLNKLEHNRLSSRLLPTT